MPPSGDCLHRIALAAAMVIDFGCETQNTNKKLFSAINYHTFFLANRINFETRNGPSTQLINATSCVKM
jgi:hypothetical protein